MSPRCVDLVITSYGIHYTKLYEGIPGNPDPDAAFSGSLALGTDLTGTGANPYNYEPGVSEAASYKATSPVVDLFYYKNLNLFFERYLNIEVWDEASIQSYNFV